jgi:phosphatidylglycerophosphate synthase
MRPIPDAERARKPVVTLFGWLLFRRISLPIALRLARTPVRPWQITLFGLGLGVTGAVGLSLGTRAGQLVGGALALVAKLLDAVDGEVARAKHMDTAAGYIADGLADRLRDTALIVGAGVGLARAGDPTALAWTLAAVAGYLAFFYVSAAAPSHWREVRSEADLEEKHMFRVTRRLRLGAGDTITVLLAATALIGRVEWFLWAVAVTSVPALGLKTWRLFRLRPWDREHPGEGPGS